MSEATIPDKHPQKEAKEDNLSEQSTLNSSSHPVQADIHANDDQLIPINEEKFSISKETLTENIKIEKRWITKTKSIKVPFLSEEVYVNNRQLKYYEKLGGNILSKVKDKIKEGFDSSNNTILKQDYESKREIVPIFEDGTSNNNNNIKEIEKVIPIFGEEIVISKRTVKLGELVIKKNSVTANKKIDIDVRKEKVTVEYPDGTRQGSNNC